VGNDVTSWVAGKLEEGHGLVIEGRTPEGFLIVGLDDGYLFNVAVLGVKGVIGRSDVEPLFAGTNKPELIINVPSRTHWSGSAISYIHNESAAFGTMGDISRAAKSGDAGALRDKNMSFFITAMEQHSNVRSVSYIYDTVFQVNCISGSSHIVAVIDAYNMSAEDVRNTKAAFGNFDVVIKSSNYGSITSQAVEAARMVGAEALSFKGLMGCLGR
jgi:hypothetical protein